MSMGQVVTDQAFDAYNLRMHRGLVDFINKAGDKVTQWGDNIALVMSQKEMATIADVTRATMKKYMNLMEEKGIAEVETKRGVKGGTVVVFNADMLNFPVVDNPITSDTKEAKEIRDSVYPKMPKKEPKRHYRTKTQIAEDRALKAKQNSWEEEQNDKLERQAVDRDFFSCFDDPEYAYKGYLLSRLYNAYSLILAKDRSELFAGNDEQRSKRWERIKNGRVGYDVLKHRFVGTYQYNTFVRMAKFLDEAEIAPEEYLTVQFDYACWASEHGHSKVGAIPYVNSLLSESALKRWVDQVSFEKWKFNKKRIGFTSKVAPIGTAYPIVQVILSAYKGDHTKRNDIKHVLGKIYEFKNVNEILYCLSTYHHTMVLEVRDAKDLNKKEKEALLRYIDSQVAIRSGMLGDISYLMSNFSSMHYLYLRGTMDEKIKDDFIYGYIGNTTLMKDAESDLVKKRGERLVYSFEGTSNFSSLVYHIAIEKGYYVDPNDLKSAIEKIGKEKVPMDAIGMLDYSVILEKFKESYEPVKPMMVEYGDSVRGYFNQESEIDHTDAPMKWGAITDWTHYGE